MKTKQVVINVCYGGFSLSPLAIKELARLKGKKCFFFKRPDFHGDYIPCSVEEADKEIFSAAYTIPNPNEVLPNQDKWHELSMEERKKSNETYDRYSLESRTKDREDKDLVKVVKNLGTKADGKFSKLKIVKIPADVEYSIEEYDGTEWIAEKHRTWR